MARVSIEVRGEPRNPDRDHDRPVLLSLQITLPEEFDLAEAKRALLAVALQLSPQKPQPVLGPAGSVVLPGPGSKP